MSPEFPFIASGALLVVAGVARNGGFPKDSLRAIMGISALALVASATANTRIAPLVRAIGFLFLLASGMASINALSTASKKRKATK